MTEIPKPLIKSNNEAPTDFAGDIIYGTTYPNDIAPPEYKYDDNGEVIMEMAYCSLGRPLGLMPKQKVFELPNMDQVPEEFTVAIEALGSLLPGHKWHDWNFQRQQNQREEQAEK